MRLPRVKTGRFLQNGLFLMLFGLRPCFSILFFTFANLAWVVLPHLFVVQCSLNRNGWQAGSRVILIKSGKLPKAGFFRRFRLRKRVCRHITRGSVAEKRAFFGDGRRQKAV